MSQPDQPSRDPRHCAIRAVISAYLDLPDTPNQASPRDFTIATTLIDDGIDVDHILRAIRIGFVRRWARDPSDSPLPPIRSLAYFRAVLENLSTSELSDDYALYINHKFDQIRSNPQAWVEHQIRSINTARRALHTSENRAR